MADASSEDRYAVKRQKSWFWSRAYNREEIQGAYDLKKLEKNYFVCPWGEADRAVSIEKFLQPGFKFAPRPTATPKPSVKKGVPKESEELTRAETVGTSVQQDVRVKPYRIFISYRRADTIGIAGRIYDRLVSDIGSESIFMDVDNIPLGVDFQQFLSDQVKQCSVFLVLIGDTWLGENEESRRIDDPSDFVRVEVEAALALDVSIIPVLIGNAEMPASTDLPKSLSRLAFRNGMRLDPGSGFHSQMNRLVDAIKPKF